MYALILLACHGGMPPSGDSDFEQHAEALRQSWIQTGVLCRCEAHRWFQTKESIDYQTTLLAGRLENFNLEACPPEEDLYRLWPLEKCNTLRNTFDADLCRLKKLFPFCTPTQQDYLWPVIREFEFRLQMYRLMATCWVDSWEGPRVHLKWLKEWVGDDFYYRGEW